MNALDFDSRPYFIINLIFYFIISSYCCTSLPKMSNTVSRLFFLRLN